MAENNMGSSVETTDRGMFDFLKKKEEVDQTPQVESTTFGSEYDQKPQVETTTFASEYNQKPQVETTTFASEFDQKVHVSEPHVVGGEYHKEGEEKKHESLLEKFHRDDSSSSSSSDEEGDDEEKRRRKKEKKEKKSLKDKLKEKLPGHKDSEEDTNVPIEKCDDYKPHVQEVVYFEPSHQEAEKGFLDKIKDKLPGHNKAEEHHDTATATPVVVAAEPCVEGEKDKKGFLDKIKEKIPGFSSKTDEEKKEHEVKREAE